jgi:hypothetical protein
MFEMCTIKQKVVIPKGTRTINARCFSHSLFKQLEFDSWSSVAQIGENCFKGSKMANLRVSGSVHVLGTECLQSRSFEMIALLHDSKLTTFGEACFRSCHTQCPITVPPGIQVISRRCFEKSNIPSIKFAMDAKLSKIAEFAFAQSAINTIDIPEHEITIDESAFGHCKQLTTVEFTEKCELRKIGRSCFVGCPLEKLKIPQWTEVVDISTFPGIGAFSVTYGNQNSVCKPPSWSLPPRRRSFDSSAGFVCPFLACGGPQSGKFREVKLKVCRSMGRP